MDTGRTLEILKKLTNQDITNGRLCKVNSVDKDALTIECSPLDNPDISFYDVRLSVTDAGTNVMIPKLGSTVIIEDFKGGYYVSMFSEIEKYYQATDVESVLDLMSDFIDYIINIQVSTPQGPSTPQGVINVVDFQKLKQRFKNFYLK